MRNHLESLSMTWNIDLIGEAADIGTLGEFAPFCDCAIADGVDGRPCLRGARFERLSPGGSAYRGRRTLLLLNGSRSCATETTAPSSLGRRCRRLHPDGRRDVAVAIVGVEARARVSWERGHTRERGDRDCINRPNRRAGKADHRGSQADRNHRSPCGGVQLAKTPSSFREGNRIGREGRQ